MTGAYGDGTVFNPDGTIRKIRGARWAISRHGIDLIQETPVDQDTIPQRALRMVYIDVTEANLEFYFLKNKEGRMCPTFEFMQLWHKLEKSSTAEGLSNV